MEIAQEGGDGSLNDSEEGRKRSNPGHIQKTAVGRQKKTRFANRLQVGGEKVKIRLGFWSELARRMELQEITVVLRTPRHSYCFVLSVHLGILRARTIFQSCRKWQCSPLFGSQLPWAYERITLPSPPCCG